MTNTKVELYLGDCLDVMRNMDANSVDSIVTDPPYGLEFMGKEWDKFETKYTHRGDMGNFKNYRSDTPAYPKREHLSSYQEWCRTWAVEALRVAKPGCIMLAFGGTRTFHRLACAIEDAGWEIRDTVMWVYGSGFPKSLDISKAIDKAAGAYVSGARLPSSRASGPSPSGCYGEGVQAKTATNPQTDAARLWQGWGTALKPAWEPIIVAMKPLDGTFAQNAERHGVAGLWIDGCRITYQGEADRNAATPQGKCTSKVISAIGAEPDAGRNLDRIEFDRPERNGRWPANLIHDGSHEAVACFPASSITGQRTARSKAAQVAGTQWLMDNHESQEYTDTGSAARFFYCAKASRAERELGLEGMEEQWVDESRKPDSLGGNNPRKRGARTATNSHPTVKPLSLMRYLVRLTKTPTGGLVLDPFMGSGTTGCACVMEGRGFIGIELSEEYLTIAKRRIEEAQMQLRLPEAVP